MKTKFIKLSIGKIFRSKKRFISLLCMALLGVGFFAGIKATVPDMLKTLDNYLDKQNVFDIEVSSYAGLTDEDIEKLENEGLENVTGSISYTIPLTFRGTDYAINLISLTDANKVILKEGRMPSTDEEILVEEKFFSNYKLSLDTEITLNDSILKNKKYKIVGTCASPLYFTSYRGVTNILDGNIDYYFYLPKDSFRLPYYTHINGNVKEAKNTQTNSQKYLSLVNPMKNKIESLKEDYIVSDRNNINAYASFISSVNSIKNLGMVFPLAFFVVALLISLISTSRMVEEERTETGTLLALGYSSKNIYFKNILYSFLATFIGALIGMMIGFYLIPHTIWTIYSSVFKIEEFVIEFNTYYAVIGMLIALICICGSAFITTYFLLKEKPSALMRPKAPKGGKEIFLEKFKFWKKLKFSKKITIRNIFRYKRRVIITIIGIASSTALMLVGFGLKDSITDIISFNYQHVFVYDRMLSIQKYDAKLEKLLKDNQDIKDIVIARTEVNNIYNQEHQKRQINMIIPEVNDINAVIHLNDINNSFNRVNLSDDGVILSAKLAKVLNVKPQDEVRFLIDNNYVNFKVDYIVENYIYDYVYMSKSLYENNFKEWEENSIYLTNTKDYNSSYDSKLLANENVFGIVTKKITSSLVKDVLASLDSVVAILIISSALLSFVILYNLSTINISERRREISTLKVLGFYDEEVDHYITSENYFITIIGIALGLFLGGYLCFYVISTCELDNVMFIRNIKPISYIVTAGISFLFTLIISGITHHHLKKIDMIESLKNNE